MAKTIKIEGEVWEILSTGVERDGLTYAHLASTTRKLSQRNGAYPIQMNDWIDLTQAQP